MRNSQPRAKQGPSQRPGLFRDAVNRFDTFAQEHILPKNYEFAFVTLDSWDVCWRNDATRVNTLAQGHILPQNGDFAIISDIAELAKVRGCLIRYTNKTLAATNTTMGKDGNFNIPRPYFPTHTVAGKKFVSPLHCGLV